MYEKRNLGIFDNFCKSKPEIMCTRTGYCCSKLDDNENFGFVYRVCVHFFLCGCSLNVIVFLSAQTGALILIVCW